MIGADCNAALGGQIAHIAVAALLAQQRMPDQAHIVQRSTGADNTHIDLTVVGANIRPPAERRSTQHTTIRDQHLQRARSHALAIGHDCEAHRLVANQPRERCPHIGRTAEAALGLTICIANHQRVDSNADLKHKILFANLHRIDAGDVRLAVQQRAGSFQIKRNAQLARKNIRRANRNNAQARVCADQSLGHLGNRAIAAGRHNHTRAVGKLRPHNRHDIFGLIAGGLINIGLNLLTQLPFQRLPNIGRCAAAGHWVEHYKNARLYLLYCCHSAFPEKPLHTTQSATTV